MGCRPVSFKLITIRLRAVPFNDTDIQAYAPTSEYDDDKIQKKKKKICYQLQNVIGQTKMKDVLVVEVDWNAKVDKEAYENQQGICGPFCNDDTNETGLGLLEFATFDDLVLANTFGHHKASRRWAWHSQNG